MNDDELITAVRDSFTGVRSATPAERVISRSRAVRARRRVPAVAAAVTAAAAAVVAVSVALPASHPAAGRPASGPAAQLAAWTITKQADGNIYITVRELRDPAGLQSTLRADGVPASVTFYGRQNPACKEYPASQALMSQVFPSPAPPPRPRVVIAPSALPRGAGVQLTGNFQPHGIGMGVALVQASPQCTGS